MTLTTNCIPFRLYAVAAVDAEGKLQGVIEGPFVTLERAQEVRARWNSLPQPLRAYGAAVVQCEVKSTWGLLL